MCLFELTVAIASGYFVMMFNSGLSWTSLNKHFLDLPAILKPLLLLLPHNGRIAEGSEWLFSFLC